VTQLQVEHDRLEHLATRREREFTNFSTFASSMRSGADDLQRLISDLRGVTSGLSRTLDDLATDVSRSNEQQRSLLLAVSNLEKMASSSIQNDQAVSRQMSQAALRLAETADKAITGAESAAQAGRVALDAGRGISAIAEDISASQSKVDQVLSAQNAASSTLAESLRSNATNSQATTRQLADIGKGLAQLAGEFDRIGAANQQQVSFLQSLIQTQQGTSRDLDGLVKELGNAALASAQRQREMNQDFQHLVQRLDGLTVTLNSIMSRQPGSIRSAGESDEAPAETSRWNRNR